MMRFSADENFNNDILRGLQRRNSEIDIIRIQDTEVYQADDPTVLAWTAREGRILLTDDVRTMPTHAYQRVKDGELLVGVFIISDQLSVGPIIEELLIIAEASTMDEWENQVVFLPL
jgi:Domain of unknown function (DUF5615)